MPAAFSACRAHFPVVRCRCPCISAGCRIHSIRERERLRMQIKSQKTFFSGIMFTCFGAAFALGAANYNVGSAARMGPGYFPLIVGVLLTLLGLVVIATAF